MMQWFKENRARIGAGILAAVVVAQASPLVQQHPVWSLAIALIGAYVRGSGAHKSDDYYRDRPY
jgi:hypothetical protein